MMRRGFYEGNPALRTIRLSPSARNAIGAGGTSLQIVEDVLRRLGITGEPEELRLNNVEETGEKRMSVRTTLTVSPVAAADGEERLTVPEVFSVKKLNLRPQRIDWREKHNWKHLAGISIPDTNGRPVELLLGANVLEAMLQKEKPVQWHQDLQMSLLEELVHWEPWVP
ncbi:hypothetical protein FJT64_023694 [Amphibalanus amphitrite]|uniref:Uncharacterized protein n=1 Tax=Amphibalanus amphitrite TaxID=1232801 RepID=A0A6A4WQV5_AMPAM|nr:hypothetical protein FJT64_023694 [Amphibalanus amphitrite]